MCYLILESPGDQHDNYIHRKYQGKVDNKWEFKSASRKNQSCTEEGAPPIIIKNNEMCYSFGPKIMISQMRPRPTRSIERRINTKHRNDNMNLAILNNFVNFKKTTSSKKGTYSKELYKKNEDDLHNSMKCEIGNDIGSIKTNLGKYIVPRVMEFVPRDIRNSFNERSRPKLILKYS